MFIESLLPAQGYLCVVEQVPSDEGKPLMRHYWVDTPEQAQARIEGLDKGESQLYIAQASFREAGTTYKGRKRDNVSHLRNFFLDIDCGPDKAYASQKDGVTALKSFCEKLALPFPAVVSSGNGLYAHWKLQEDLSSPIWIAAAALLQQVVKAVEPGLDADGICADAARILRPVGSTHKKDATNHKAVRLLVDSEPLKAQDFVKLVHAAATKYKVAPKLKAVSKTETAINAAFLIEQEDVPAYAVQIAQKCPQMAYIKDVKGNVAEPVWYAAVGLLRYTKEAPEIIHEWSQGHPDYSTSGTDAKIQQHTTAGIGPTTCAYFAALNPQLCTGCAHQGRITTPLMLGRMAPEPLKAEEVPEDTPPEPPRGFTISKKGVHYVADDATPVLCYPYPLYVTAINADYFGESVTVKHYLPHEGWAETVIPSSATQDPRKFFSTLLDNHIHVVGRDAKGLFMSYFELFMTKVRSAGKINKLASSMGWHGEIGGMTFAQGPDTHHIDGTTTSVGYSSAAPDWVKALYLKGGVDEWVENTRILNTPGLEGLAFEFLVSAFGSPLVHFTGYSGAMVSVVGDSGVGKTITGKWGLSAWGDPEKLALMRDDTRNALLSRLGVYGSLPAYIDEVSNIASEELSEIVYRITQGREKIRLDKNAKERKNINTWQMLAVVSSNHSLMDKISTLKGDAEGELNRIFEYEIYEGYDKEEAQKIVRTYTDNHGHVGKIYAKHLTETQYVHQRKLDELSMFLDKRSRAESGERFWTMIGAVALYGGALAQKLGISHVDVQRLVPWICEKITEMRKYKKSHTFDAISWIGAFLDRHVGDFVVVKDYMPNKEFSSINHQREPKSRLIGRIEEDQMLMWISVDALKKELQRDSISYRKMVQLLRTSPGGNVLADIRRITLGRGTVYSGVAQTCWEINLEHPELKHKFLVAVQNAEERQIKGVKK